MKNYLLKITLKSIEGITTAKKSTDEYIKNFKYSKNSYGTGGTQYGVGHYTITDKESALRYGKEIEIAIPRKANIIEYDDLINSHYRNFEKYNDNLEAYYNKYGEKVTSVLDAINNNDSATAILENYDVVKKDDIYIILNRGIIKVKE